jgi:hypothetical protein
MVGARVLNIITGDKVATSCIVGESDEGASVGCGVGEKVVLVCVGVNVICVGAGVIGRADGPAVGGDVGIDVGVNVISTVGPVVGAVVTKTVGLNVGCAVGTDVVGVDVVGDVEALIISSNIMLVMPSTPSDP